MQPTPLKIVLSKPNQTTRRPTKGKKVERDEKGCRKKVERDEKGCRKR
jgi:hypothetical protein